MKCSRCNSSDNTDKHHIHCKFMDNKDGYGITTHLCRKCHTILGLIIPSIIWKYIHEEDKLEVINAVRIFSIKFLKNNNNTKTFETDQYDIFTQKCICGYKLDAEDFFEGYCSHCNKPIKIKYNN